MIFTMKGEMIKKISSRGEYQLYQYSKTEFLILKFPEYTSTHIIAIDFLKDTERIVFKSNKYLTTFYLSFDRSSFTLSNYSEYYYGSFKSNDEIKQLVD